MKFLKFIIVAITLALLSACTSTNEKGITISKGWLALADAPSQSNI